MAQPTACDAGGRCWPIQLASRKMCPAISAGPPPNHRSGREFAGGRGASRTRSLSAKRRGRGSTLALTTEAEKSGGTSCAAMSSWPAQLA
eukprot:4274651-Pyramimonas_sp.AAC.1